ncbi:ceramide-1-phosphate transfer protein-like isoform X2 [Eriocheir sinensis]|uniref:ceramide-1-phosphate transfer protein-like isoform X2 n=1 Tax=Eriocheir sinensis TaxID=95602 RepID=UPI0021C74DC2|nr:ceramide-1-phosphate transfer protein-like isoform X2 [Eriocheir sinensis]
MSIRYVALRCEERDDDRSRQSTTFYWTQADTMAGIPLGSEPPQQTEEEEAAVTAALAEARENGVGPDPALPQDLVFDLQLVLNGFSDCRGEDGQLYLDAYLRAYSELNKFLQLLGTVFNFVSHDIQKKVTILQCYRKGGAGDYYYSIQSMIEYEQENNLLTSSDRQSGSRTLLRLHRGLEFISGFMAELHKASDTAGLGSPSSELYGRTLAKHHNWVLAKTVGAVLLMMPNKQTIIERMTGGTMGVREHNEALMPKVIEVMNSVYNLTQKLYEDYNILDLP